MQQREHLLEVRAVGVAVEIDRSGPEGLEDGGQIVGGVGRAVEGRALTQGSAARSHQLHRPPVRTLKLRTVDGAGFAGSAVVHEHDVA